MTSRNSAFGLGIALSMALSYVGSSATLLAQEADAPPSGDDQAEGDDATADEAPAEASESESVEAPAEPEEAAPSAEEPPAEEPAVSTSAAATVSAPEPPAAEPAAPEAGATILPVEQLPGSAYPSIQIRGLANGSLARTFHGQQWPYMPGIEEGQSLQIGLSGYVWNDLSNTRITADKSLAGSNINDQNRWTTQTRGVLRVTPTYNANGGWFTQANAEIVVQGDMSRPIATDTLATTDDLWVRAGKWNVFDVTVGRFQGWEIANHYGMALDLNTLERLGAYIVGLPVQPADGYGLTYFWDRQDKTLGGYALHVYPTKFLRGEVLGHVGGGNSQNAANPYQMDIRPSAIFDIGFLKLKGGWEYGEARPQDSEQKVHESKNGYGFAAQFVLDPYVEFGGSFGRGFQDVVDNFGDANLEASNTVQTVGGFLNGSPGHEPLVLGVGAFLNSWEDLRIDQNVGEHQGKVDTNEQWLLFGAVQYTLWKRLNLKFVVSSASNKVEHYRHGTYVNNALSGRFRMELLF
jgi:hypothetical protein